MTYADTSFVVSLYVEDGNTATAKNYFSRNPEPICQTIFSKSEALHALRILAFQKRIASPEMTRALLQFERDETEGFFNSVPVDSEDLFRRTTQLSNRHTVEFGVRYLDTLHVASALLLKANRFLTFDARQGKLARAVGLHVKP